MDNENKIETENIENQNIETLENDESLNLPNEKEEQLLQNTTVINNPQVVKVEHIKEIEKIISPEEPKTLKEEPKDSELKTTKQTTTKVKTQKTTHPIFLIILIIFLFLFVLFLPQITDFITEYKNNKNGINQLKNGKLTCTMNIKSEEVDYNYELIFNYTKNRLQKSMITTTSRLSDDAKDNNILKAKQASCEILKNVLDKNNIGMNASCKVSAAMQKTTQNIDYKKLDLDFIADNIAEFDGFYPEYEYNESITVIQNKLEKENYKCNRNEY